MDGPRVPFNSPRLVGLERQHMSEALAAAHISGDGAFTRRCHAILERETGAAKALLTTSCTHAMEMAALLLGVAPGDQVVVPSFSHASAVSGFVLRGATPVFSDVRPDTFNLDESRLEDLLTPRTKAIVVVHYAGVGCEMDAIQRIADTHGIVVIEDNAHGLFGRYRGRPLGSFGRMATQSFHETKNIQCGEGGALLLNDANLVTRAEIVRQKGTNRAEFFRGTVDKYTWVDIGSSWLPSELLAAFLFAQLERRDAIQAKRRAVWERYRLGLAEWADENCVGLPTIPAHCQQPHHMFYVVLPSLESRTRFLAALREEGFDGAFHYQPLHASPMGRSLGGRPGQCPVAERAGDRLARLPFYNDLAPADQDMVIEAVRKFVP